MRNRGTHADAVLLRRGVLEVDADARTALGTEQLILGLGVELDNTPPSASFSMRKYKKLT